MEKYSSINRWWRVGVFSLTIFLFLSEFYFLYRISYSSSIVIYSVIGIFFWGASESYRRESIVWVRLLSMVTALLWYFIVILLLGLVVIPNYIRPWLFYLAGVLSVIIIFYELISTIFGKKIYFYGQGIYVILLSFPAAACVVWFSLVGSDFDIRAIIFGFAFATLIISQPQLLVGKQNIKQIY